MSDETIQCQWDMIKKRLSPFYYLSCIMFIGVSMYFISQLISPFFVFYTLPSFYLLTNYFNGILLFHADYILSKKIGYEVVRGYLWERWQLQGHTKHFKIFRTPGYDCRLGQLKALHNRRYILK